MTDQAASRAQPLVYRFGPDAWVTWPPAIRAGAGGDSEPG